MATHMLMREMSTTIVFLLSLSLLGDFTRCSATDIIFSEFDQAVGQLASKASAPTACNPEPKSQNQLDQICDSFCKGECDFVLPSELPVKPHRMIVYRETPINVTTLPEKDCGDAAGDLGFYLSNHNLAYLCTVFPNSTDCKKSNAIERGSQNNVFIKFEVEVDGQFGPYHMCNPMHGWDTKHWECLTYCETPPDCDPWDSMHNRMEWMGVTCFCENGRGNHTVGRHNQSSFNGHHGPSAPWPQVCKNDNFDDISSFGYELVGSTWKLLKNSNESECCSVCNTPACAGFNFDNVTKSCRLISSSNYDWRQKGGGKDNITTGYKFHQGAGHISPGIFGGYWYSMPAAGECHGNQTIENGDCTWRVIKDYKHVNRTCVNGKIDKLVEDYGASCFKKCKEPTNPKTECYASCFAQVFNGNTTANLNAISPEKVLNAFYQTFESDNVADGGCPPVKTPPKHLMIE